MPSSFTKSKSKTTQQSTLPPATPMESKLYDQLASLSNQQAGTLTQLNLLQRALLSPHETLQELSQPWKPPTQAEARDPLEGLRGNQDVMMRLQQQIAQNQAAQQAQAQQLTRMQNPYGLTSEEQAGINDVYGAAQNRAMNDMNLQFQDMVTSRGLNRYDTPAAEPLARNMGLMLGDINAQRSAALLNRGEANRNFGMNQIAQNANLDQMQFGQGLALNQMTPGATQILLASLLQQRLAQATTTSTNTNTPSLYDTMMRGVGTVGSMVMGAYGGGMLGAGGGGGLNLASGIATSGSPITNYSGGLGGYSQGGNQFLVNMPKF